MGTYKNNYNKQEDEALWELHEIQHKLSEEYKSMSVNEINKGAQKYWESIKKKIQLASTKYLS